MGFFIRYIIYIIYIVHVAALFTFFSEYQFFGRGIIKAPKLRSSSESLRKKVVHTSIVARASYHIKEQGPLISACPPQKAPECKLSCLAIKRLFLHAYLESREEGFVSSGCITLSSRFTQINTFWGFFVVGLRHGAPT